VTATSLHDWLAGLGLERYAEAFEREAVDLDVLPELTDAQLERLGVAALGHRLKILRAAAALRSTPSAAAPGAAAAPVAPPVSSAPAPGADAERRQLTVMFCDLVGSTALAQRLDPEDLRALMQRYQQTCGEIVKRHHGTVAQYLGDGLMVYFGWPHALEDAAARAVHAGLAIVQAVRALDTPEPLAVRVGIATGSVVVGEGSLDNATGQVRTAVGETPNLAARVQGQAGPGELVVAAATRRLLGAAFACEDLGDHELKGIAAPVRLWRVHGEAEAEGRFAAAHSGRLTPLVNRDLEISLLLDRWVRAADGEGQAVVLTGEAGIGKSRVIAELIERVPSDALLLRLQCSELHRHSAFHPLLQPLARAAAFEREDSVDVKLDKLEALLARAGAPAAERAPYLASLLSLPVARYPAFRSSAAKLRAELVQVIVQTVLDATRRGPRLMLVEDLHWMDPSTLDVMNALVSAMRRRPLLLVLTTRQSLGERWASQPHATSLSMVGLSRGHSLQLAGAVAAQHGLLPRILERIVERTDGVPLYLEELTRTLAEGAARTGEAGADSMTIPETLKDSLAARLDQLGRAKRAAQLGAVLGRQFRHDVLLALSGLDAEVLAGQTAQVLAAGLANRVGFGDEAVYTFHHALIQDAAYESLLRSERRSLHARAGEILATRSPEMADHEPEVLARHFTLGEQWDRAAPLWLKAGQRAWLRSAAPEAIAHYEAGLAIVDRVSDAAQRDLLELRLRAALGVVYFAAVSYAAPQAQVAFERAMQLAERVSDPTARVPVYYGMGAFQTMKGDARSGHAGFEHLHREAEATGSKTLLLYSRSVLAWSAHNLGQFERSVDEARQAWALYEGGAMVGPRLSAADPRIISECFRAQSLWAQGFVEQARTASAGVLAHARRIADPYSLAYTLNFAALLVPEQLGEHEHVIALTDEGIPLAAELGYPMLELGGILWRAWHRAVLDGDTAPALALFDELMPRLDRMGVRYLHPHLLARRARLHLRAGEVGAAQLAVAQALAEVEASGLAAWACDVALAEGEVALAHGGEHRALARSAFESALDMARAQGARSWQLRAALALAELAAEDEGPGAALALVEPILQDFPEGRDGAELQRAMRRLAAWSEHAGHPTTA
jgi:class 3 adenylate cyclase/tetratricopeptide (TPR) repeat protein